MICYLLHSEFFKKSNLYFHQFFANSQLLLIHIANSKPWERFIFLSVTNEKIVPYQLIFTENEIESLPGTVGGRSNSGLSCASLSLRDAQMK